MLFYNFSKQVAPDISTGKHQTCCKIYQNNDFYGLNMYSTCHHSIEISFSTTVPTQKLKGNHEPSISIDSLFTAIVLRNNKYHINKIWRSFIRYVSSYLENAPYHLPSLVCYPKENVLHPIWWIKNSAQLVCKMCYMQDSGVITLVISRTGIVDSCNFLIDRTQIPNV